MLEAGISDLIAGKVALASRTVIEIAQDLV